MNFRTLFIGLSLIVSTLSTSAQKADFQFFTTDEGLSGNSTTSPLQDRQGFLWMVNDGKVHRFDGKQFERFFPPRDLPGSGENVFHSILLEDTVLLFLAQRHLLLFATISGEWQSYQYPFDGEALGLVSVVDEKTGEQTPTIIEVSTARDSIHLWQFTGNQFLDEPLARFINPPHSFIFFSMKGEMYAFQQSSDREQRKRMRKWNRETSTMTSFTLQGFPEAATITGIQQLGNGQIYLILSQPIAIGGQPYYQDGVFLLDTISGELTPHLVNRQIKARQDGVHISSIHETEDGNTWLPGGDRHLYYYNSSRDTLFDFHPQLLEVIPNFADIQSATFDRNGSVWFGTQLGLLQCTLLESVISNHVTTSHRICNGNCSFRGMTEDAQGNILAMPYIGIVRFHPDEKNEPQFYVSPNLSLPSDLTMLDNKILLNNGVLFDPKDQTTESIPGADIRGGPEEGLFAQEPNGRIWWIYYNDLFYLIQDQEGLSWHKAYTFPQERNMINESLYFARWSNRVFIGREEGLFQHDPATGHTTQVTFAQLPFSNLRVLAMEEDVERNLWLATDQGLIYFNPETGATTRYTRQEGLPHDFICGMLPEGDSCLWLSTNHGLSRFSIATQSFINFFEEDGLTHNEFNRKSYFKTIDGRFLFGGLKGINSFYPTQLFNALQKNIGHTNLLLTAFEFVDEDQGITERRLIFPKKPIIELFYHHRSFNFEYALTDFRNPSEVTYSYRMKGYQDTWSSPSKFNFARFSSLPAGTYEFQVKAKDSHGLWQPNQLSTIVIVHPPWWDTWWAYSCYLLLILGFAYLVFVFLAKRLDLQHKLKDEQAEALRLKQLDSFKSRLYTNITHEFRTPLTVILGMNDQIRQDPQTYLEKGTSLIQSNGQNLLRLINQLLDLSKLEDNAFQLQLEHGDLVSYLRYITESFQTYANSKNIALRFHSTLEALMMDYDPEQLKQVLTNLVSNALKFTPSGGRIEVRVSSSPEASMARFSVNDSGIGIAADELPFIFDRFYQVDGSHTRAQEGTGIGLAHALELVKLMGGEITAGSEPGQGTQFIVTLPIHAQAIDKPHDLKRNSSSYLPNTTDNSPAGIPDPTPLKDAGSKPHLLIIEDNPDVVDYLTSCLQDSYHLDIAFNGRIGIQKAIDQTPDIVISDVMMPEQDGYAVCDALKNDPRTSHIPIILLTAKADTPSKITGLQRGADAYLLKPFDKKELMIRLTKMMERQQRLMTYFSQQADNSASIDAEGPLTETIEIENIFIKQVRTIIEDNYRDEDFGLPQLCRKIGMSRSQLYRKMKALIDIAPSDFIRNHRLNQARLLLETTDLTVSEVGWEVGFKDLSHFSKAYQAFFGELPSTTSK